METRLRSFLAHRWAVPERSLRLEFEPLSGGRESIVTRARVDARPMPGTLPSRLVVKELRRDFVREVEVYDWLWRHLDRPPTARVFGAQVHGDATYLYLEDVPNAADWPWAVVDHGAAVCRQLARLHDSALPVPDSFDWDYEDYLVRSAASTLEMAGQACDDRGRRIWLRRGELRRVVERLSDIRARLLADETTLIHGDVHPGNIRFGTGPDGPKVALIDWGRARLGSPLEDIASWLHSLGCWEPVARRRHDTLMRAYLEARRQPQAFTGRLRADYWFASASNGLSGAIRHHLAVAADPASTECDRRHADRGVAEWQRVIRRAATLIAAGELD